MGMELLPDAKTGGMSIVNVNDVEATSKDAVHVPGQSPFTAAARENWHKAKEHVQRHVAVSQAFNTLRDMNGSDFIRPEQLKTMKLLGQGAFATVEKAM